MIPIPEHQEYVKEDYERTPAQRQKQIEKESFDKWKIEWRRKND